MSCARPAEHKQQSPGLLHLIFRASAAISIKKKQMLMHLLLFYGAGDEARTRYLHLGKVALYRMSYTRMSRGTKLIIPHNPKLSIPETKIFEEFCRSGSTTVLPDLFRFILPATEVAVLWEFPAAADPVFPQIP